MIALLLLSLFSVQITKAKEKRKKKLINHSKLENRRKLTIGTMNDKSELKRDCDDKPISDETFFLLSLSSLISSPTTTNPNRIDPQYMRTIASNSSMQHIANIDNSNPNSNINNDNRIACGKTNTMTPIAASSSSLSSLSSLSSPTNSIVHTCCYKHHCQLNACHINNGEFQANTTKKLLLSIPLQRKRKKVVYNRDFIGAIGVDQRNRAEFNLTSGDQRLIISHYSCVEKFTKMNSSVNSVASTQQIQQSNDDNSSNKNGSHTSSDTKISNVENVRKSSNSSSTADEGYLAMASPYSSSGEDEDNRNGNHSPKHEKVERSASSDSALGLDEEVLVNGIADLSTRRNLQRRVTLTVTDIPLRPALLPVAEPNSLPDSPLPIAELTSMSGQTPVVVPSKMLLEARVVEIPSPLPSPSSMLPNSEFTKFSYFDASSRRESNVSDCDDIVNRVRIVRTPSVVVSDYSDDVLCGITLEELEYFRQQRKFSLGTTLDCSSPNSSATDNTNDTDYLSDMSAASSCSNLNYCGSTISVLDDNYTMVSGLQTPERKLSNCSTCSTPSGLEDNDDYNTDVFSSNLIEALNQQRQKKPSGWRKLRNIVQWTPFFQTYKKQRYPWVQLAGHQGNFKAGPDQGTVLKKLCPKEELCFNYLMKDVLRPYVPEYKGQVTSDDGELYLQLQDLLSDFDQPCVMDCKIGVRTYLEEELSKAKEKPKLRKDMYEKMIQIDKDAPNDEEHRAKGVTKPRYMVWRETISSTATLGFRIEGVKKGDGTSSKDFKTTKSRDQILDAFKDFTDGFEMAIAKYIQRLKAIRATLLRSDFFQTHEVIGSSLLFVHDRNQASIWLIDFAKTVSLPNEANITHSNEWIVGNHEDGYLIGINNLIQIFEELSARESSSMSQIDCPADVQNETCELDIDAMKIDQTVQQSHYDEDDTHEEQKQ